MHNTLRATRLATQATLLLSKHVAQKQAKYQKATVAYNTTAYNLAVQQLAAQYGLPVPSARNTTATATKAPQSGVTAQVWQIAAQYGGNRKATLQACASAGINAATAATQYARYKNANKV